MRRVVVDPEVPARTADLFRQHASLLSRIRAGWSPEPAEPASRLPVRFLWSGGAVSALLLACLLLLADAGQLFFFVLALLALVILVGFLTVREPLELEATEHELYREARWYEGRYLLPAEDFDHNAGRLLERAQRAIDFILRSRVNRGHGTAGACPGRQRGRRARAGGGTGTLRGPRVRRRAGATRPRADRDTPLTASPL
ncbi:hypothetical protein [Streptosporangium amethystogenes]|uniref:hypothetical protein n=1 Tax=Streptosporangium amethystogenes TaxID=2002 RepID=UPI001B805B45|nr:hypothetical protein [Streptosporangium amethystogenes]